MKILNYESWPLCGKLDERIWVRTNEIYNFMKKKKKSIEPERRVLECLSIAVWFQNIILLIIIITCEIWIGCWLMVDYILCAHICELYKCEIQLNANKTWDFFVECHANTQTHTHTSRATHQSISVLHETGGNLIILTHTRLGNRAQDS